ncbi:MAG TPA: archease [Noviherbaspirillum sp.]|uniref:archease n=1 Tax=Noviherbaspirillum sp. TaxID=1926288 RepID=UPI002B4813C6|nr:archease [Noviherbaspirillum sp.]HJV88552.1 archease [Noviherbaspirillum sp.]
MLHDVAAAEGWEHFRHGADIGIRGIGKTRLQAFEQAGLALTSVVTEPESVRALHAVDIRCSSPDDDFLFLDWINALIYEMATRGMLFRRFVLSQDGATLYGTAWGEPVDVERHCPAVEPKGATLTELKVQQSEDGRWIAQCVVDV